MLKKCKDEYKKIDSLVSEKKQIEGQKFGMDIARKKCMAAGAAFLFGGLILSRVSLTISFLAIGIGIAIIVMGSLKQSGVGASEDKNVLLIEGKINYEKLVLEDLQKKLQEETNKEKIGKPAEYYIKMMKSENWDGV